MKGYLIDENLPTRIAVPTSLPLKNVREFGSRLTDSAIWKYALDNELVIVSRDADFSARIILQNPPPWVVHLRFGNLRLSQFKAVIERVWPQIEAALKTKKLIHVFRDRIEGIG